MAAPMKEVGTFKISTENVDKLCDFLSEEFDPLTALYSLDESDVPAPEIAPFNSLTEYSNAQKGLTHEQRRKKRLEDAAKAGSSDKKDADKPERQWEKIIKPEILEKIDSDGDRSKKDIAEKMMVKGKHKARKDILKALEGLSVGGGPLAVLSRAMKERIQVKVWTRSAVQVRGFSVGFVAAFDRHWNLALTDVDETYCRPCQPRTSFTLPKHVLLQMKKEAAPTRPATPPVPDTSKHKPSVDTNQNPTIPKPRTTESLPTGSKVTVSRDPRLQKVKSKSDTMGPESSKDTVAKVISQAKTTASKLVKEEKSSKGKTAMVVPGSQGYGSEPSKKSLPRFPRGIEVKTEVPGLKGRIFVRHINQVFLRGDSVVMIQLLS